MSLDYRHSLRGYDHYFPERMVVSLVVSGLRLPLIRSVIHSLRIAGRGTPCAPAGRKEKYCQCLMHCCLAGNCFLVPGTGAGRGCSGIRG